MSYIIRDRSDGMFEVVFLAPILVGIFPERETAEKVCALMDDGEAELPLLDAAGFGQAKKDVTEAASMDLTDIAPPVMTPVRKSSKVSSTPSAPGTLATSSSIFATLA